jgi:hypothetical protein
VCMYLHSQRGLHPNATANGLCWANNQINGRA